MKGYILTTTVALLALGGCSINKADYVSEPVEVSTAKGVVTCQLYRDSQVVWDEAVAFPQNRMTLAEADQICKQEGERIKEEGRDPVEVEETEDAAA